LKSEKSARRLEIEGFDLFVYNICEMIESAFCYRGPLSGGGVVGAWAAAGAEPRPGVVEEALRLRIKSL
jgi:hypothetical protein